MPFHIQPIREFLVRPALPASLSRMAELAYNVLWSWEPMVRALFRRLDPALWRECGYNPVLMLGRVPQATLQKAGSVAGGEREPHGVTPTKPVGIWGK